MKHSSDSIIQLMQQSTLFQKTGTWVKKAWLQNYSALASGVKQQPYLTVIMPIFNAATERFDQGKPTPSPNFTVLDGTDLMTTAACQLTAWPYSKLDVFA